MVFTKIPNGKNSSYLQERPDASVVLCGQLWEQSFKMFEPGGGATLYQG
jgi:hypothetical protein